VKFLAAALPDVDRHPRDASGLLLHDCAKLDEKTGLNRCVVPWAKHGALSDRTCERTCRKYHLIGACER
jgi:hypothetical protein